MKTRNMLAVVGLVLGAASTYSLADRHDDAIYRRFVFLRGEIENISAAYAEYCSEAASHARDFPVSLSAGFGFRQYRLVMKSPKEQKESCDNASARRRVYKIEFDKHELYLRIIDYPGLA
jgi:hypothetical protein